MSDPRSSQNAARLSEDIGDVLSAIRRLIAEDEAIAPAHDPRASGATIDEDAGDFLARRYGGNSALARRLAGTSDGDAAIRHRPARPAEVIGRSHRETEASDTDQGEVWPLGQLANSPGAARPVPPVPETPMPSVPRPPQRIHRHDTTGEAPRADENPARNDLARSLSAVMREHDVIPDAPLRLDATRRVLSEPQPEAATTPGARTMSAWRSWIRPEPPLKRVSKPSGDQAPAPAAVVSPEVPEDEDGFAEAFEWKARMRPELGVPVVAQTGAGATQQPVLGAGATSGIPPSGWVTAVADADESNHGEADFADALAALDNAELTPSMPASDPSPTGVDGAAPTAIYNTVTGLSPEVEEQSIRDLLREMIQEELHGELGERFSRNLRAVIRREVASAIDDYLYQR